VVGQLELDDTDKAIIRELQVDGRLPYAKLAPLVGLSEAATRQRVNKLLDHGAMQIVAVTDPAALGLGYQAWLGITVEGDIRAIADKMSAITAVDYLIIVAGRYDLMVEIVAADSEAFLNVLNDQIRAIPGVKATETMSYLKLVKQTYNWGTG
jgi:Lrp/AsnC family transcriptional regulator for asnA, asnC and gidA